MAINHSTTKAPGQKLFAGADWNADHTGTLDHATELTNAGINTHAQIDSFLSNINGAWTSFTPSWANVTVGSGTNTGAYIQVGKKVFYRIRLTLAADSAITGHPALTFPVAIASYGTSTTVGELLAYGAVVYPGVILTTGKCYVFDASGSYATLASIFPTTPFTWTTGNQITIQGFYEAA